MNPVAFLFGAIKALAGRADWADHFNLTRSGLQQSFIALLLTIPAFYLIAHAVQLERAKSFGRRCGRRAARAICDYPAALSALLFGGGLYFCDGV